MIWEFDIEESLIIYKPLFLCNQKEPNLDGDGGGGKGVSSKFQSVSVVVVVVVVSHNVLEWYLTDY